MGSGAHVLKPVAEDFKLGNGILNKQLRMEVWNVQEHQPTYELVTNTPAQVYEHILIFVTWIPLIFLINDITKQLHFHNNTTYILGIVVNCRWGSYQTWSECTKSCGGGTRESIRVIEQEAKNGGVPCVGSAKRTVACNKESCPGKNNGLFLFKWYKIIKFLSMLQCINMYSYLTWNSYSWLRMGQVWWMGRLQSVMWRGYTNTNEKDDKIGKIRWDAVHRIFY